MYMYKPLIIFCLVGIYRYVSPYYPHAYKGQVVRPLQLLFLGPNHPYINYTVQPKVLLDKLELYRVYTWSAASSIWLRLAMSAGDHYVSC